MSERVRTLRMATGGEAVARLDDGCVVFVGGACSDELIDIEITERRRRFARGHVTSVIEPGGDRAPLTCDHASSACGGCDWLHLSPAAQRTHKLAIVAEQLQRLGGIDTPVVEHHDDPPGQRTTVRCVVTNGRAGYRRRRSHDAFAASSCQAAHPMVEDVIVNANFGAATNAVIRAAPSTGERLVVVGDDRDSGHAVRLDSVDVPPDVTVVAASDTHGAGLTHEVAGHRFFVSAHSFFQTSDRGTETLVAVVADALGRSDGPLVDLYGGVGLLGGAAARDRLVTLVEQSADACRDAARNLGPEVEIVTGRVEDFAPTRRYGAVIADPARAGLRSDGVAVVNATGADHLVLVSCDPASLGRDVALLREAAWIPVTTTVIDMFPDTSRIEAVTELRR